MRFTRVIVRHCLPLLLCTVLFSATSTLLAAPPGGVTLDEAVESVRNQQNGRVLSAKTQKRNGGSVHVIKLLRKDGRVKQLRIDGASGQRLPAKQKR